MKMIKEQENEQNDYAIVIIYEDRGDLRYFIQSYHINVGLLYKKQRKASEEKIRTYTM